MLAKRDAPTPTAIEEAKFLVEKVEELQMMMDVQLEEALEWLGVTARDYALAQDTAKE